MNLKLNISSPFRPSFGADALHEQHTVKQTYKNVFINVKAYFTNVFDKLIEGGKDYEELLPSAVAR